jgi:hypothetical protein
VGQLSARETLDPEVVARPWISRTRHATHCELPNHQPRGDYFPPLRIKLGLMNRFVKVHSTFGECFQNIFSTFPAWSFERMKADVFDERQGPCSCRLPDDEFVKKMNDKEKAAWLSFLAVNVGLQNFLGNNKADWSNDAVGFFHLWCNMCVKLHSKIFSRLDKFLENFGVAIGKQKECFHQQSVWLWKSAVKGDMAWIWWQTTAGASNDIALRKFTNAKATSANSCLQRTYFNFASHPYQLFWSTYHLYVEMYVNFK